MKIAPKGTVAFFHDHDPTDVKSSRVGYFRALVSVFDHILTAEECDACGVMFYREALENGKEKEYLAGERHFLAFYQDLAKKGAYVKQKDHIWFTTQPLDYPEDKTELTNALEWMEADKLLLFSSDYPHWTFDDPQWVAKHIPARMREKVMLGNALELFKLPASVPALTGQKRAF